MIIFTLCYFAVYGFILLFIPKDYIHAFVYINPIFRFADFYIGILLYKIYSLYKDKVERNSLTGLLLQIISILTTGAAIFIYRFVPECLHYQALFFFPSALIVLTFSMYDKALIKKLLDNKIFMYLGEISYTFYMLHTLGISFVSYVISYLGLELNYVQTIVLQFVFVLTGSTIVHFCYEKPIAKKLLMVIKKKNDS